VAKIRCHALHHYTAAYMRHLAANRSGYAAQRKFRQEIAAGKLQEHPIHAARRVTFGRQRGLLLTGFDYKRDLTLGNGLNLSICGSPQ
jgi:hypothetical protein